MTGSTTMGGIFIGNIFGCFAIAAAVGVFCGTAAAQREPSAPAAVVAMSHDDLPDAALRGDLLEVAVFDFTTGDRTAWMNAALVITGGKPTTQPVSDSAPLPLGLDKALGPILATGADRLVYSIAEESNKQEITLGIRLRPGVTDDGAMTWLHRNVRTAAHFDHEGRWLLVTVDGVRIGVSADSAIARPVSPQADEIRQDLNCWGEDVPVKAVYVSSESVKKHLMNGGAPPAAMLPLVNLYWSAKYIYLGAKLGVHPQIEARWIAADENGADQVIKEFQTLRTALKQPNNFLGIPPAYTALLDQFQPTRDGNIARISMDQKGLSNLFGSVIAASMSARNAPASPSPEESVSRDWKPIDAATDSAAAQMRLILAAIVEYDQDHQALPVTLDDLVSDKLLPGPEVLRDPRSNSGKTFVYIKPAATKLADIASRDKTAILVEDKEIQANQRGLVGYADGHVGDAPGN